MDIPVKFDLVVRDAKPSDVTFLVESNAHMALETEQKTLSRVTLERGINAVFDHPDRGYYLIAERAGQPVGCLLVTFEWSDWRNGQWWWIQSVYVVSAARRSGVFRALYAEVERRAKDVASVIGLRLYVERDNARAQSTYRASGMEETSYRLMEMAFAERESIA